MAGDKSVNDSRHSETELRWVAPEEKELFWESWGEQHAVFDTRSGETHLLPDPTARVLQQLIVRPATVKEVTEILCAESGEAFDERSLEVVARHFRQLENVDLIENADT